MGALRLQTTLQIRLFYHPNANILSGFSYIQTHNGKSRYYYSIVKKYFWGYSILH